MILPVWADKALEDAREVMGVSVSEICRVLLIAPIVLDPTVRPEMAVIGAYAEARDAIAKARIERAQMHWEAEVPPDETKEE